MGYNNKLLIRYVRCMFSKLAAKERCNSVKILFHWFTNIVQNAFFRLIKMR